MHVELLVLLACAVGFAIAKSLQLYPENEEHIAGWEQMCSCVSLNTYVLISTGNFCAIYTVDASSISMQFHNGISILQVTTQITMGNRQSTNSMENSKCKLIDWSGKREIVALGRVYLTDLTSMVRCVSLGKNAVKVKVWVDIVNIPKARLWRTTYDLEVIKDALGTTISWPAANVIMQSISSVI